jgi:probable rRNA maturation factor
VLSAEINQSTLRGGQRLSSRDISRVLREIADVLRLKRPLMISIAFVNERTMRRLNREYRGKDRVTDVLSFTLLDPRSAVAGQPVGELLLCYPQARRQAAELDHSVRDELLFLIVHGVLHLFGYDHEKPAEAKRMFLLQTRALKRLKIDPRI